MNFDPSKLAELLHKDSLETGDFAGGGLKVEQAKKRKRKRRKYPDAVYKDLGEMSEPEEDASTPFVKSVEEWRYTLGPVFAPETTDMHKEWTTDDEMHKGILRWQLHVQHKDNRLRLQHDTSKEVGTVVSMFRWPYPVETVMKDANGDERSVALPAGTTYAEVIWDPKAWEELVRSGKIRGFSMGGRAKRVRVAVNEQPHSE